MSEPRERLSIAAGILAGSDDHAALLRSVIEVARSIFDARAASVMLFDPENDELVFEAVVGEGEEELRGRRIPSNTGIAGFVLASGEPMVVEDVDADPRFARDVAEGSGYVPKGLMVAPLIRDGSAIGVLSVLDRRHGERFGADEMALLAAFADQAAIALDLLGRSRRARALLESEEGDVDELGRLVAALEDLKDEAHREAAATMLDALARLLTAGEGPPAIRLRRR